MSPDPGRRDGRAAADVWLTREQDGLVEATAWQCLKAIGRAIQQEPDDARRLMSLLIAHSVHASVLAVVAEEVSPAIRERLAHDAAEAIARAVREATPR
jgi:hypothetical protein